MNKFLEMIKTILPHFKQFIVKMDKHKKIIVGVISLVLVAFSFYTKQSVAWISMNIEPSWININYFRGKLTSTHTQLISTNAKGSVTNTTPLRVQLREHTINLEPGELQINFDPSSKESNMDFGQAISIDAYVRDSSIEFKKNLISFDTYFYSTRIKGDKQEVDMSFLEPLQITLSGNNILIIKGITQNIDAVQTIKIFPNGIIGILSGTFFDCDIPIGDYNGQGEFQMKGSAISFGAKSAGKGNINILQDKQIAIDIFPTMIVQGSSHMPLEINFARDIKHSKLEVNGQLNNLDIANITMVTNNPLKMLKMNFHSIVDEFFQHFPMK